MKVLQLLPTLAMGDAIGNDVRALDKVIRGMGYHTGIYAEVIDGRLPEGTAQQVEKMSRLSGEDVILYHMSTGSELNFSLEKYPCRKLMVFHNITPPRPVPPRSSPSPRPASSRAITRRQWNRQNTACVDSVIWQTRWTAVWQTPPITAMCCGN